MLCYKYVIRWWGAVFALNIIYKFKGCYEAIF